MKRVFYAKNEAPGDNPEALYRKRGINYAPRHTRAWLPLAEQ
jgi:hypothetical protein